MRLWHDDIRPAPRGWTWCRTNEQAMTAPLSGDVMECSLDHDLGLQDQDPDEYMRLLREDPDEAHERIFLPNYDPEENGFNLVRWMCEQNVVPKRVTVHSWNHNGARRMATLLNDYGHDCILDPFNETTLERNAVTDFGLTGPEELGWGKDRYQPGRAVEASPELAFWGDCANTHHEESKQFIYASRMGLYASTSGVAHPPTYDIGGRSIIDIGGGPVSLLLKCVNRGKCAVVDPIIPDLPPWVYGRYFHSDIEVMSIDGEAIPHTLSFNEAWIYNVLQHVRDPGQVVRNALIVAKTVRIFEWIDVPAYEGHPHELRRDDLDRWFNGRGYVAQLNEAGCVGTCWYGVFSSHKSQPI